MELSLIGKRAVVCGSTQGIGKASAIELAALGANVTLVARDKAKLKEVLKELPVVKGQTHDCIVADFNFPERLQSSIEKNIGNRPAHILVNNTGGPAPGTVLAATLDEFTKAFTNHLLCNQVLVQSLVPGMKKEKYGRIINIISTSVKIPIRGMGVSNTIRGAVASWSKTLATELAPLGITVNNVLPGTAMTGRLEAIIRDRSVKQKKTKEQVIEEMISEIPAGRISSPAEVAAAVAFLATPAAAYITGINIPVDGGRTGSL
jgi:3-oxoacyl-[acyl-carrier protein] reductase